jgi:hypothetical protein
MVAGFSNCTNAQNQTPEKFKNNTTIPLVSYKKHETILIDSVRTLIFNKKGPYFQKENDASTAIVVDTILYSPDLKRFAFFALTGNTNNKLISGGNKNMLHYDGHAFIGNLDYNKNVLNVTWVRGFNLSNYRSLANASKDIRQIYFSEISQRGNDKGQSTYKYNFDDVRFWNGPLWSLYFK